MKKILFIAFVFITTLSYGTEVFDKVVDPNGKYTTISRALSGYELTPPNKRVRIFIKNGTYNEDLSVAVDSVSLIGESVDGVIITNNAYINDADGNTAISSATVTVTGDAFYAENITIKNTAEEDFQSSSVDVGQALALRTYGNGFVLKNCKLHGYQDTYYAQSGKTYVEDCYIEGATDFIYGGAPAFFQNCTINCVDGGYITAPDEAYLTSDLSTDSTLAHGILFNNCIVTADDGVSDCYLGRPWGQKSSTVYINCTLPDAINSAGWTIMGDEGTYKTAFFAEYGSIDSDGNTVSTDNRVDWSHQLTADDVTNYFNIEYFFTDDGTTWDPTAITIALDAPTDVNGTGYELSWTAVDSAMGYAIIRNDSVFDFSETNSYTDESVDSSITNVYSVKSVYTYGNLSTEVSNTYSVEATSTSAVESTESAVQQLFTIINNNQIIADEPIDVKVVSLDGKCMAQFSQVQSVDLSGYSSGLYLIQANNNKASYTQKIILR